MTPAIERIRQEGDLLEQSMFADEEFASMFPTYAEVWGRFLLPHRDPKRAGFALDQWQPLGENHYSAIVRCWNMRSAYNRIQKLCVAFADERANKGIIIVELQGAFLTFFAAAGAFTENLDRSFRFVKGGEETFRAKCLDKEGSFRWFYDRRSQQVHNILVPLFPFEGTVHFDGELFKAKNSRWEHAKGREIKDVAAATEELWKGFVEQSRSYWSELLRLLKEAYPNVGSVKPAESSQNTALPEAQNPGISIPPSGAKMPEHRGVSGYDPKKDRK